MSSSPIGKYLKTVFAKIVDNFLLTIAVPFATAAIIVVASRSSDEFTTQLHSVRNTEMLSIGFLLGTALIVLIMRRPRAVYLIDYACFRPPNTLRSPSAGFVEHVHQVSHWTERSKRFVTRLYERSGLGEQTGVPPVGHYVDPHKYVKFEDGREEAEMVVFSAIDELFSKTSIAPQAVDILVTNISEFNPTPTFSDMIINRYKMRSDIHHVHLSSMGCSAGLISIELVKNLLQAAPLGANALVVSTETISGGSPYLGNERAMLLPFCLFRMGGAALLLSSSPTMARFRLRCIMRTLTAASDQSYQCIYKEEDDKGYTGVNLSSELVGVAARTVKANITSIAPLVLPPSEKLLFAASFAARKLLNGRVKLYIPDFLSVFQHLCIHAGGRAVIDNVQRSFGLSDEKVEPSRMTLHRFGNTSSSSIWYELAYVEAKGRMDKGNQVWMIGFGSGFKCNSAVWECVRPVHDAYGPWADCIDRYPVHIP